MEPLTADLYLVYDIRNLEAAAMPGARSPCRAGEWMNGSKSQLDPVRFGIVLGVVAVLYGDLFVRRSSRA